MMWPQLGPPHTTRCPRCHLSFNVPSPPCLWPQGHKGGGLGGGRTGGQTGGRVFVVTVPCPPCLHSCPGLISSLGNLGSPCPQLCFKGNPGLTSGQEARVTVREATAQPGPRSRAWEGPWAGTSSEQRAGVWAAGWSPPPPHPGGPGPVHPEGRAGSTHPGNENQPPGTSTLHGPPHGAHAAEGEAGHGGARGPAGPEGHPAMDRARPTHPSAPEPRGLLGLATTLRPVPGVPRSCPPQSRREARWGCWILTPSHGPPRAGVRGAR